MKRRLVFVLSFVLVLAMALSGCGGGAPAAEAPAAAAPAEAAAPLAEAAPTEAPAAEAPAAEAPAAEAPAAEAPASDAAVPAAGEGALTAVLDTFASSIPEGFLSVGGVDTMTAAMDAGALAIDVREPSDYAEGHIPGAINIPIRTLAQSLDQIPTDQPVIIYCGSGLRAGQAVAALHVLGYDNVKSFPGSWRAWTGANGEVSTEATEAKTVAVPEIEASVLAGVDSFLSGMPDGFYGLGDVTKLQEAMDAGAFLLDVREESEVAEGAIPGSLNVPLRTLMQHLDEIPTDRPVVVYCASGHRASMANAVLHMAGFDNARVFSAGYGAWAEANQPSAEVPAEIAAALDSDTDAVAVADAFLSAIPEGFYSVGSADKFVEMMDATSPLVIDVREASEYAEGHVPGAVNIPMRTLTANLDKIPVDTPVVVYCASGHRAGMSLAALQMLGYDNVKSFPGGWAAWSAASKEVSTEATVAEAVATPEVAPEVLAMVDEFLVNVPEGFLSVGNAEKAMEAVENGAAAIDVREASEFAEGHVAGAVNIPIRTLAASVAQVPTDQPVIVYCASGHRAAMATAALHVMGFDNVRSFPAGYGAWEAAGGDTE